MFLHVRHLVSWPPIGIQVKFYGDFPKLLNGLIDIDSTNFFVASASTNTQTRGNSYKLKKNYILNIRDANNYVQ